MNRNYVSDEEAARWGCGLIIAAVILSWISFIATVAVIAVAVKWALGSF